MPPQPRILLPAAAFRQSWEWEIRTAPLTAFGRNDHVRSRDAKQLSEDETLDVLAEAGLAAGGILTREYRDILAILARGLRFTAYIGDIRNSRTATVVVAVSGAHAVRASCANELVQLDAIPPEAAVESLVDTLPAMPPARLEPVAIPKSQYRSAGPAFRERYDFTMDTKHSRRDPTERPRTLMAARRLGMHQLHTGDHEPVTILDIAGEGRVLTFVTQAPGEEAKVHFQPGRREHLIEAITRVV